MNIKLMIRVCISMIQYLMISAMGCLGFVYIDRNITIAIGLWVSALLGFVFYMYCDYKYYIKMQQDKCFYSKSSVFIIICMATILLYFTYMTQVRHFPLANLNTDQIKTIHVSVENGETYLLCDEEMEKLVALLQGIEHEEEPHYYGNTSEILTFTISKNKFTTSVILDAAGITINNERISPSEEYFYELFIYGTDIIDAHLLEEG